MASIEDVRFTLRLTPELKALVSQAGKKNNRAMNAEILSALEWRFRPPRALRVAQAIEPLLEKLSEEQLEQLVEIIRTIADPADRGRSRRSSGRRS